MAFRPLMHCVAAIVVLLLVCCFGTASAAVTDAQKLATYTFLQNLAANVPTLADAWTGDSYDGWTGVTVDSATGYVSVDLSSRSLSGTLPATAATRDGVLVTSLDLSGNPSLYGVFDDSWAKLTLLKTLDLSSTGLYGYIPNAWNGMVSATSIKISNVNACGGLPNWSIATLQTVDLSSASLRGKLANSWINMVSLTSVTLTGNDFCGCVPSSWTGYTVLTSAVSSLAVAGSTCGTTNTCATSYVCYTPTVTTTTKQPGSAAFGSAAVASLVTLATLAVAALMA